MNAEQQKHMGAEGTSSTLSEIYHVPFGANEYFGPLEIVIFVLVLCLAVQVQKADTCGSYCFWGEKKKKDDEVTSALFQIVHLLSTCTDCKQAIK